MKSLFVVAIVAIVAIAGASSAAVARPAYPDKIPNGNVYLCATCHVDPNGGGPRNPFGEQIALYKSGFNDDAFIPWADFFYDDADGDGLTNGEELGDPEGTFIPESASPAALRSTCVSPPGDPENTGVDLASPDCATIGEHSTADDVDGDGPGVDVVAAGGCSATRGDVGALVLAGLFFSRLRRGRRR